MSARNWSSLAPIRMVFVESDQSLESKDTQKVLLALETYLYTYVYVCIHCAVSLSLSLSKMYT